MTLQEIRSAIEQFKNDFVTITLIDVSKLKVFYKKLFQKAERPKRICRRLLLCP